MPCGIQHLQQIHIGVVKFEDAYVVINVIIHKNTRLFFRLQNIIYLDTLINC